MSRFRLAVPLVLLLAGLPIYCDSDHPGLLRRIQFGSCVLQSRAQPIFTTITRMDPDLFIFLGDNIYADTVDMAVMQRKYNELASSHSFQRLVDSVPVLAVWDDHDYGANDAGSEYPKKEESKKLFLDFWREPENSPRRRRPGIYAAHMYGPAGRRVQVILLDTRTFRDPLVRGNARPTDALGPYVPNPDPEATILGERQWLWLKRELVRPAGIRIIVSSIQVIPDSSGWESWANFPSERKRLLDLIVNNRIEGVIFISGDRHFAELSELRPEGGYPLYELTSSALNFPHPSGQTGDNRFRIGEPCTMENFGEIRIRWEGDPLIDLSIRDLAGDVRLATSVSLAELTSASPRSSPRDIEELRR
jgi:alkaline phosphatase D